jgi:hypothetical protein
MSDLTELGVYLSFLCEGLGHVDRHGSLREYCSGLMLPMERKSIEPLAACAAPWQVGAKHQALHHFVAKSDWSDDILLDKSDSGFRLHWSLKPAHFGLSMIRDFPRKETVQWALLVNTVGSWVSRTTVRLLSVCRYPHALEAYQ